MGLVVSFLLLGQWPSPWSATYLPDASTHLTVSGATLGVFEGAPVVVYTSSVPSAALGKAASPTLFFDFNGRRFPSSCQFEAPDQIQMSNIGNGLRAYVLEKDTSPRYVAASIIVAQLADGGAVPLLGCSGFADAGIDVGFRLVVLNAGVYLVSEGRAGGSRLIRRLPPLGVPQETAVTGPPGPWSLAFPDVIATVDGGVRVGYTSLAGAVIDGFPDGLFPDVGALRLVSGVDQRHTLAVAARRDQSAIELLRSDGGVGGLWSSNSSVERLLPQPPFYATGGMVSAFTANTSSGAVVGTVELPHRETLLGELVVDLKGIGPALFALLTETGPELRLRKVLVENTRLTLGAPVVVNRIGAVLRSVSTVAEGDGFVVTWQEDRDGLPQSQSYRVLATVTEAGLSVVSETPVPEFETAQLVRSFGETRLGRKERVNGSTGEFWVVVSALDGGSRRAYLDGLELPASREFALAGSSNSEAVVVRTEQTTTELEVNDGKQTFAERVWPRSIDPLAVAFPSGEVGVIGWHANTARIETARVSSTKGWKVDARQDLSEASIVPPAAVGGHDGGMLVGGTLTSFWMAPFDGQTVGPKTEVALNETPTHVAVAARPSDYLGVWAVASPFPEIRAQQSSDGGSFVIRRFDDSEVVTMLRATATHRGDVLVVSRVVTRDLVSRSKLIFDVIPIFARDRGDAGLAADAGFQDPDAGLARATDGGVSTVRPTVFFPRGCGCETFEALPTLGLLWLAGRRRRASEVRASYR
jgi:hypothetical protein